MECRGRNKHPVFVVRCIRIVRWIVRWTCTVDMYCRLYGGRNCSAAEGNDDKNKCSWKVTKKIGRDFTEHVEDGVMGEYSLLGSFVFGDDFGIGWESQGRYHIR